MLDRKSMLFISSNIGSLFDKKYFYLELEWKNLLLEYMARQNASLVVLTLQEFGGKHPASKQEADKFLSELYELFSTDYPTCVSCVDWDTGRQESFTALCTLFFIAAPIGSFELFNFKENSFKIFGPGFHVEPKCEDEYSIKVKFPLQLFPEAKWSRKGFLINRCRLDRTDVLDTVNLHLIHSFNFFSVVENHLIFQEFRKNQLRFILHKLDELGSRSAVLCGDFNFRISIMDLFAANQKEISLVDEDDDKCCGKIKYIIDNSDKSILGCISTKDCILDQSLLPLDESALTKYLRCDIEAVPFSSELLELPVTFTPTYCYCTDGHVSAFSRNRVPSWCDRVFFRGVIAEGVRKCQESLAYESLGNERVIGDHKPVAVLLPIQVLKRE